MSCSHCETLLQVFFNALRFFSCFLYSRCTWTQYFRRIINARTMTTPRYDLPVPGGPVMCRRCEAERPRIPNPDDSWIKPPYHRQDVSTHWGKTHQSLTVSVRPVGLTRPWVRCTGLRSPSIKLRSCPWSKVTDCKSFKSSEEHLMGPGNTIENYIMSNFCLKTF